MIGQIDGDTSMPKELQVLMSRIEDVRRTLESAGARHADPSQTVRTVLADVEAIVVGLQSYREAFPLLGTVADTLARLAHVAQGVADQVDSLRAGHEPPPLPPTVDPSHAESVAVGLPDPAPDRPEARTRSPGVGHR